MKVKLTGTRGRGLFTVAAVKAGDLLLCEKAFSYAFSDNKSKSSSQSVQLLCIADTIGATFSKQVDLMTVLAQKIYTNPSLHSIVTYLYYGDYQAVDTTMVDGKSAVDS